MEDEEWDRRSRQNVSDAYLESGSALNIAFDNDKTFGSILSRSAASAVSVCTLGMVSESAGVGTKWWQRAPRQTRNKRDHATTFKLHLLHSFFLFPHVVAKEGWIQQLGVGGVA